MACEGCVESVTKALQARTLAAAQRCHCARADAPRALAQAAKGVVTVSVDLASGVACVGVQAETAVRACRAYGRACALMALATAHWRSCDTGTLD